MEKLFNDNVHGQIKLPLLCVKIIDTHIFQRLRHIKQLGVGYYVYPGAAHNRFEHCLGVCHLAGVLVDELNRNRPPNDDPQTEITPKEKLCVQVAGLCHDLGHGPFSHIWETFMHETPGGEDWKHEDMSVKLFEKILEHEEIKKLFEKELKDTEKGEDTEKGDKWEDVIKYIIKGEIPEDEKRAFLYEIICNEPTGIDVDKWDYLLRDSKLLNINIMFNPHRLMKCQRVMKAQDKKYHICYNNKVKEEIWHMYMMRAELHRKAYQHTAVLMIQQMLIDAFLRFNESQYTFLGKRLSEAHTDTSVYASLTNDIYQELYRTGKGVCPEGWTLLNRIEERKLYKSGEKITLAGENKKDEMKFIETFIRDKRKDLYVTKFEVKIILLEDLKEKAFLYNKNGTFCNDDWTSVPLFYSSLHAMNSNHIEAIIYSKKPDNLEAIEVAVKEVMLRKYEKEDGIAESEAKKRK